MKRATILLSFAFLAILMTSAASAPAFAQEGAPGGPPPGMAAGPFVAGEEMKALALANMSLMEKNIVQIAKLMPADKLGWNPGMGYSPRPADYVSHDYGRTFANLCLHLANLTFSRPPLWGAAASPAFKPSKDYEDSTTDRDKLVEQLTAAFDYGQNEVKKLSAADLAKTYKVGNRMLTGNMIIAEWMESLDDYWGQSKAYAHVQTVVGTDPGGFHPVVLSSQK